ncbi:MAG TPA: alpha-amylase family glycosyl hydrolase [Candidatus Saccharimonadales bacterium]|jgi:alpha-glucosidase|nr:alpha-amylase family glycosyl hydrolase [Candidatus Saccharimonadales bacterium]
MKKTDTQKHRWPEGAIVYQIYPRSFYDSNGDGIGDIPGIIKKLDYLKDLGVNAIWLSPFYPSPMADFGYDVADYCDVDPIFGELEDMDELLKEAHKIGVKVIVDLVPNHTSDEHEWFRQSKQSREDKYSDWYVWKDPKGHDRYGQPIPPNNWLELLTGESAWQWEPERQQFYLHSFDIKQADLNWSNPEVREAFKEIMRFWLDRGVDGFRVDAVSFMAKDPQFRDEPLNPHYKPGPHTWKYLKLEHPYNQGWPPMYAYLSEMAAVLKEPKYSHSHRFMVTEAYTNGDDPVPEYLAFYEGMDPEVAAPFNFEGLKLPWRADMWRKFLKNFHTALDDFSPLCVPSYAFGNHDQNRLASRLDEPAARAAAVLLLTLPGMAFIYDGDEIGMQNGHIPPELVQDPGAKGGFGRDPERTPLQWSPAPNAGFSTSSQTWLPVADNYKTVNVETESQDPDSFLSLYRQLTQLRNTSKSLRYGNLEVLDIGDDKVLCFTRTEARQRHLVLVNFSKEPQNLTVEPLGRFVLSSDPKSMLPSTKGKLHLRAHEAAIFVD